MAPDGLKLQLRLLGMHLRPFSHGGYLFEIEQCPKNRLYKTWVTEGGIRCPCIVHYPKYVQKPRVSHSFATCMDLLPTSMQTWYLGCHSKLLMKPQ